MARRTPDQQCRVSQSPGVSHEQFVRVSCANHIHADLQLTAHFARLSRTKTPRQHEKRHERGHGAGSAEMRPRRCKPCPGKKPEKIHSQVSQGHRPVTAPAPTETLVRMTPVRFSKSRPRMRTNQQGDGRIRKKRSAKDQPDPYREGALYHRP